MADTVKRETPTQTSGRRERIFFQGMEGQFLSGRHEAGRDAVPFMLSGFPTVEINNTFYQMPKASVLENWTKCTRRSFRFAIKAPRRITHFVKLDAERAAEPLSILYKTLPSLGPKRGPVLFQLPPFLKKDYGILNGVVTLFCYQVGGQSRSGRLPGWRLFVLSEMSEADPTDEPFAGPRPVLGDHLVWGEIFASVSRLPFRRRRAA